VLGFIPSYAVVVVRIFRCRVGQVKRFPVQISFWLTADVSWIPFDVCLVSRGLEWVTT
jgi:hypothetical protein